MRIEGAKNGRCETTCTSNKLPQKGRFCLTLVLALTSSLGCRSVLPSDQPSRLWDATTKLNSGINDIHSYHSPTVPRPIRMSPRY